MVLILTPDTWPLTPDTWVLTPESWLLNPVSFQQPSRFQRVTIFVFYNIPALPTPIGSRPFVFIDIPALFVHFLKLLALSFPEAQDFLSQLARRAKRAADANAVSSRQ
jgi:hypothetical protein